MLSGNLGAWERSLAAHLAKLANKRLASTITLIEVIDAAALWSDPIIDLAPALAGQDFQTLMEEFPAVGCAAATEIGFRFEGVGTVFWGKFEDLVGGTIPSAQRPLLARAFSALADRFALQRPGDSGFANQFSIIAWPIANALMPYDLAGPVGRLLARGPVSGLAGGTGARRQELSPLRTWAQSWEGARLTDWLQQDGPAARVIAALLSHNAKGVLSPTTFARLSSAFLHHSEAYFALREARRRKPALTTAQGQTEIGHLSLQRHGDDFLLSVAWPALPAGLADQGRQEAAAHGWRPKLWGQTRTAADNVFGPLPIVLRLNTLPHGQDPAFQDLTLVFGEDSEVAQVLARRVVDWDGPLVFLADGDEAERISLPVAKSSGVLWVIDRDDVWSSLPRHGSLGETTVRLADLTDPVHRACLAAHGWVSAGDVATPALAIARRPQDALTLPRRQISAEAAFCLYDGQDLRVERLRRRAEGAHGLTVGAAREGGPAAPGVFLFERESAFDALVEQRLLARMQGSIPGARWPVEIMLLIDDELLAYASEILAENDQGLSKSSRVLEALQAEPVRRRILAAGRATLRVRVGRHPWETVALRRHDGDLDWTLCDPALSLSRPAEAVAAPAHMPYRFDPAASSAGVRLHTYRFEDGRLASPGRLEAPNQFNLGDLSGDFGPLAGRRRLRAEGGGVLDLARARRGWATAEVGDLAALAARTGVLRQFEAPLVAALCGPEWADLEGQAVKAAGPGERLFEQIAPHAIGDQADALEAQDRETFAVLFSQAIEQACPDWCEYVEIDDERADEALNTAFAAVLAAAQTQGRPLDVNADDMDFGASADQWRAAAQAAITGARSSPLAALIAPTSGAKVLTARQFVALDLAQVSSFLADWTRQWCLPRSQLGLEVACGALQFWLTPTAAEPDGAALAAMSRDVFLARAVRFVATRMQART